MDGNLKFKMKKKYGELNNIYFVTFLEVFRETIMISIITLIFVLFSSGINLVIENFINMLLN